MFKPVSFFIVFRLMACAFVRPKNCIKSSFLLFEYSPRSIALCLGLRLRLEGEPPP